MKEPIITGTTELERSSLGPALSFVQCEEGGPKGKGGYRAPSGRARAQTTWTAVPAGSPALG